MADQPLDQIRRMLAVAVDEQHGAAPRVFEAGKQRRLLAEIARQRNHLDVDAGRRQVAGDGERAVAAAVVDIDDLAGQRAGRGEALRDLKEPAMHARQRRCLVIDRHHDGQTLGARIRQAPLARHRSQSGVGSRRHSNVPFPPVL